jgi:hypothetical protein
VLDRGSRSIIFFSPVEKGSPIRVFSMLSIRRTLRPSEAFCARARAISSPIGSRKKRNIDM